MQPPSVHTTLAIISLCCLVAVTTFSPWILKDVLPLHIWTCSRFYESSHGFLRVYIKMEYWNSPWVRLNQGRNMLKQLAFGSKLIRFQNGSLQATDLCWTQLRKIVILPITLARPKRRSCFLGIKHFLLQKNTEICFLPVGQLCFHKLQRDTPCIDRSKKKLVNN